jgi:hypothetical protein
MEDDKYDMILPKNAGYSFRCIIETTELHVLCIIISKVYNVI